MAFSSAVTKKYQLHDGMVVEEGTFDAASVTSGTITRDTTSPVIADIEEWFFSSDGDHPVTPNKTAETTIKITTTTSDTGKYRIKGRAGK